MNLSRHQEQGADIRSAFRSVPRTGVIYVMHRAEERGFFAERDRWSNLGQGAPEVGALPGAPERRTEIRLPTPQAEYAPVAGTRALRERVADYYNATYRAGRSSRYTADNVSIAPGGRAAMTRIAATLGHVNMGHFIPDYTAYEELLTTFRGFVPIPIVVGSDAGSLISVDALESEIVGRGLAAVLLSNPCNPTGQLIEGELLGEWTTLARATACTMVFDEFYSHYVYTDPDPDHATTVSAAEHVDDVDEDPVLIVNGLTKNWRYPGWRISWIVGPRTVIEQVNSAGSFLDGGANHPFQVAATELLDPALCRAETVAIQREFGAKRTRMVEGLRSLGVVMDQEPAGAFYVWGDVGSLPEPLSDGMGFFEAGLEERVVTVPGVFFDVNPGRRRAHSNWGSHVRFSFGPSMEEIERGLAAIGRLVDR